MADESTSVGKIHLDIEITKSSIAREMEGISKAFSSGMKSSFSNVGNQMGSFVKNTIGKMAGNFRTFGQAGSEANKQVSQSADDINSKIQQLNNQMESATNRAEIHRQKLLQLQAEYDRLSKAGLGDSDKGRKLLEKIVTAEDRVRRYGDVSDRTRLKIEQLEQSMGSLGNTTSNTSKGFKKADSGARKTGRSFKLLGKEAGKSSSKVGGFANMLTKSFMRVLKRIFILNLIYKAIRGLIDYMNGALKTNKNFVSSLNTIKTNLKVAFQPIYDFILPALTALMKAVATVTTYIAAAISALFGKSYKQSFDSAKGIEKSKKAMDGFGGSAKKAQNILMGFDEINQLDIPDDAGGGADGHELEMPDLATIDMTGIEEFKEMLAGIFKPFKEAWEKEGLNVMNAVKYAFENIKELLKAIGNSWREVWLNGTGQAIIESVLRILQLIFNVIGDIAKAFKTAWETNNLGTKLLQTIANMILSLLGLIEVVGISWREVWNNGTGVEIITHILSILQQVFELIGNIAESFRIAWETNNIGTTILQNIADTLIIILSIFDDIGKSINNVWGQVGQKTVDIFMKALEMASETIKKFGEALKIAWDTGGKHLFESLIKLAAKVIEVAGVIWNDFIGPVAKWLLDILGPAFGRALDFVAGFVDATIWWLDVLLLGLNKIKEFADKVVGFFQWVYDVLVGHSIIPDLVNEMLIWFTNLKTKGEEIWTAIKDFFVDIWEKIKEFAKEIWTGKFGISSILTTAWISIKETANTLWTKLKEGILEQWNKIRAGIKETKDKLIEAVMEPFNTIKTKINGIISDAFDWGKNLITSFIDGISSMIGAVGEVAGKVIDKVAGFMRFRSPSKEGPGRTADEWMPNFMDMMAQGIESNIDKVKRSIKLTSEVLQNVNVVPAIQQPDLTMFSGRTRESSLPFDDTSFLESLTSAIVNALLQILPLMSGQGSNESYSDKELVLNIEGTPLVRILLPLINNELSRLGYRTLFQIG